MVHIQLNGNSVVVSQALWWQLSKGVWGKKEVGKVLEIPKCNILNAKRVISKSLLSCKSISRDSHAKMR